MDRPDVTSCGSNDSHPSRSAARRASPAGRWAPPALYLVIVVSWCLYAIPAGALDLLWLVAWAVPAPVLYAWRVRRR